MMKGMMQRKAAPQMMSRGLKHWSLQHAQLTWHADHGWLHYAAMENCKACFTFAGLKANSLSKSLFGDRLV